MNVAFGRDSDLKEDRTVDKGSKIMKDFIMSALPFVVTGVCIAIMVVNQKKGRKSYVTEGMLLGLGVGISIYSSKQANTGFGTSLGMLVGATIGCCIERKDDDKEGE